MTRSGRQIKMPCPECQRPTGVGPTNERLHPHQRDGARCPGSGQRVDLYGTDGES